MERSGSAVLLNASKAPRNRPSCPLCCPLSRMELLVQKVIGEADRDEEMRGAVTII